MVPQILSLIQLRFTGTARSRAIGLYSMTLGYGVAIGLVLGGILAGSDVLGLTWRPVFLINVPVGVVLLLAGWAWLPQGDSGRRSRLDIRGVVVLTAAMAFTIIGLTFGPTIRWPLWTWICVLLGVITFIAFVLLEWHLDGRDPLLDFRVLQDFGVAPGLVVVLVLMGGYGTLLYTMSAYLQDGLGYGVLRSGLVFAAYAIGFGTVNLTWTRLPRTTHRWISPVGIAALCGAEFALAATLGTRLDAGVVVPLLVIAGAGHGTGFGALVDRIAAHVPPERSSALSGLINTVTQLAIVIGLAVVGGLYLIAAGSSGPAGHAKAISAVCVVLGVLGVFAAACSVFVSIRLPDSGKAERSVH
jgi:predicted MFS family arabinose efflux permease